MKKDIFNGKVREQYVGYMRTSIIFVTCLFLCAAILFLCMALFYENMDTDMRVVLYALGGVVFVLSVAYPVAAVLCIRSYPKHKTLTLMLVKEFVLKSWIDDDVMPSANASEQSDDEAEQPDNHEDEQ